MVKFLATCATSPPPLFLTGISDETLKIKSNGLTLVYCKLIWQELVLKQSICFNTNSCLLDLLQGLTFKSLKLRHQDRVAWLFILDLVFAITSRLWMRVFALGQGQCHREQRYHPHKRFQKRENMGYFHVSKLLTLAFLSNKEIHAQRLEDLP